ncbi:hypothetical protein XH80_24075 [Bradyrhizobium sp. CCBAU 45384]|nr:hypothetical protein [Bradyrhizobium sp. CCBAU 45384]
MLRDLLAAEGCKISRWHVKTPMRRMRIEALCHRPRTTEPEPGHKISFSNPYGPSIYGGIVDTPTFLAGGQIGYNWQRNGWLLGVELDASGSVSDGINTWLASSGFVVSASHRLVACPHLMLRLASCVAPRLGYFVAHHVPLRLPLSIIDFAFPLEEAEHVFIDANRGGVDRC